MTMPEHDARRPDPPSRGWAATGAILTGLGVALGAFGAHALEPLLSEARLATFETAVRYQTHQALGLLLVALLPRPARRAAPLLLAGTVIFSGALYLLVALDAPAFGAVAPIGGAAMIAGWLLAAWRLLRG
jgi:uncharacterized membrane protein YgdD (TMEM256/DUF423 family)